MNPVFIHAVGLVAAISGAAVCCHWWFLTGLPLTQCWSSACRHASSGSIHVVLDRIEHVSFDEIQCRWRVNNC